MRCCSRSCCAGQRTSEVCLRSGMRRGDGLAVVSWVDGNRDFSIARLNAPGYVTVNFATEYELNRHVALFGRINNLLDRQYQNPVGFQQPGVGAYAGIRVTL